MIRLQLWKPAAALLVGAVLVMTMALFGRSGVLQHIEGSLLDLRFRLRHAVSPSVPITLVLIDDGDIAAVGRWPWSREVHARLLRQIASAKPRVIGFDLLFTESQQGYADSELADAMAQGVPVIMPFAIDLAPTGTASGIPGEVPPLPPGVAGKAYPRTRGPEPDYLPRATRLRLPIPGLLERSDLAHITIVPDRAGSLRTDYPVLRYGDDYFPSLSLEAARLFLGLSRQEVVIERRRGVWLGSRLVPTDSGLRMMVNFRPPFSFDAVSASDILEGRVPPDKLRDRIVLIGANAPGIGDTLTSPYTPTLPGVERHAMLAASMLDGDMLVRNDSTMAIDAAVIMLCGLLIGLAARRGTAAVTITATVLLVLVPLFNVLAFLRLGLWLNLLLPEVGVLLGLAVMLIGQQITGASTLAQLRDQARRDPLTGLRNRAGLSAWLQQATNGQGGDAPGGKNQDSKEYRGGLAGRGRGKAGGLLVFVADLDGFKQINDTYGHAAGDRLLHEVAARMTHTMRQTDLVARMGGDEFTLIFAAEGAAAQDLARAAVQRVFDLVCAPYEIDGKPMQVGLSLGGARWPEDDPDITRVLALADAALYRAKRDGRGKITLYQPVAATAQQGATATGRAAERTAPAKKGHART